MSISNQILVDSAAFVAWFYMNDNHNKEAKQRFEWIEKNLFLPVSTSYVIDETATVLSHRKGQALAYEFLEFAAETRTIFITEELRQESLSLFKEQKQRGTSIVDCSNVVVMRRHEIPTIFSYDEVFGKHFHLQVVK